MRSRSVLFVLLLSLAVVVPGLALPPNLVKGGGFNAPTDLQLWSPGLDWQGIDAQSRVKSGSALVSPDGHLFSQCVAVLAGRDYDFGARVLLAHQNGQHAVAPAFVQVDFFPDYSCSVTSALSARTNSVDSASGRFRALAGHATAPDGSLSAMVSLVAAAPTLFDDVFVQERGGCVPDDTTLCFGGGRFGATVTYFLGDGPPRQEPVVQISTDSGYFYTYSADDAELTIELANASSKQFVIAGMTNLRLEIVVKDWETGQQKQYVNVPNHFLSTIDDAFPKQ